MKIYVLDQFYETGIELIQQHAEVIRWDDPGIANWHEDADALMVRMTPIKAVDFAKAKKLKVIGKQGVGIDTIDLDAARANGVAVCRTPGTNSEAVAEMAFVLALTVTRRVAELDRTIRAGEIVKRAEFLGLESWGKTVGVVGMGNIGTRVARKWIGAFGAKIIAFDPFAPANAWGDIPHRRVTSLDDMLGEVDILTLHLPLTEQSRNLISAAELEKMKPTSVLVNVSRGGIVDEKALFDALTAGRIFGAGLDVFEVEPPTLENPLVKLPNVVVTPHAAGGTTETQARSSYLVGRQVLDILAGKESLNRVA